MFAMTSIKIGSSSLLKKGLIGWLFLSLIITSRTALTHEFWIETETLPLGNMVAVQLRVGDGFPGELFPRSPAHLEEFFVQSAGERLDVTGRNGYSPAGTFKINEESIYQVGYRSGQTLITFEADAFEQYLEDEGLDHIITLRRQRGERNKAGRELYSRAAKSFIQVGESDINENDYLQGLGFSLEIIPQQNPMQLGPSDSLTVQVIYQSKPLAGALLSVFDLANPRGDRSRHTDDNGYVEVPMPVSGKVLLGVVHMVEVQNNPDADWQSVWASLTFEVSAQQLSHVNSH